MSLQVTCFSLTLLALQLWRWCGHRRLGEGANHSWSQRTESGQLIIQYLIHLHHHHHHHHHHHMCLIMMSKLSLIFQLTGMLRVILEPLIGDAPLVGGVTFFFIRRPVSADIFITWLSSIELWDETHLKHYKTPEFWLMCILPEIQKNASWTWKTVSLLAVRGGGA